MPDSPPTSAARPASAGRGTAVSDSPPMSAAPDPGTTTFLVGSSYNGKPPSHWNVWEKPYDEIIETLRGRQKDIPPGGPRYLVMEIVVRDTTVVASEVTVL